MDSQDVCLRLNISPRTLQTLRDNGKLPYSQIQHKIFYKPGDVEALLTFVGLPLTIQPVFYFLGMSAAQTFYPFGKLREPLADIRKGSLFNSYYFHTFNFKRFIKRVDFIFIGK